MKPGEGNILVIRGGAIGDFILTLPVLAALRRHYREAGIEVLGYPHIAQLAMAGGLADAVHSIESRALANFFARNGQLDQSLEQFFSGFTVIVSYLFDPDGIFESNVARCSRARFIAGPHRPDETQAVHASESLLKPIEQLGIRNPDPVPYLSIPAHPASLAQLALHPGSGSEKKNWPEENWIRLIQHLLSVSPLQLLLVGGDAETDRLRRLDAACNGPRLRLLQHLPLTELAARLRGCAGFIGHDSGISHLASALGLPVLVLWGESKEVVWGPRGERVTVLRSPEGLQGLSLERVADALGHFLPWLEN